MAPAFAAWPEFAGLMQRDVGAHPAELLAASAGFRPLPQPPSSESGPGGWKEVRGSSRFPARENAGVRGPTPLRREDITVF